MNGYVFFLCQAYKVKYTIIKRISILMMHLATFKPFTTKFRECLHHQNMSHILFLTVKRIPDFIIYDHLFKLMTFE